MGEDKTQRSEQYVQRSHPHYTKSHASSPENQMRNNKIARDNIPSDSSSSTAFFTFLLDFTFSPVARPMWRAAATSLHSRHPIPPSCAARDWRTHLPGGGAPRPRPPPPRPRNPPRGSALFGAPPRGRGGGRSPRSFLVSTMILTGCSAPTSMRMPPSPPCETGRETAIARLAWSRFWNSKNAHAFERTMSKSLIGPNREVRICVSALVDTGSVTPLTKTNGVLTAIACW